MPGNIHQRLYHKIDQVIFNWELLITENARSISKHMLLLKVFLYPLQVTLIVHEYLSVGKTVCKRYLISGDTTIRIGHGEVFQLWRELIWNFIKMLRRCQWWSLLLLNLNVIHTRSNWLCWKAQEKFQVESRFYKTIRCSYVTMLATYLAKKTMFKVSNRNTRKRCLSISKITLKLSDWRHLTTSYLPEVTVQDHFLDSFS